MSPTLDTDGVPDQCLSFTIQSDWGHFKRVGRTVTKQTYRIPPRTTVAGLLAAIVGAERNSYYDIFGADNAAIAITSLTDLRTINIATTGLGTDPGQSVTETVKKQRNHSLTYQDTTEDRQLHAYEVLVDPAYRLDIALENESFYQELRAHLEEGTTIYPPSMGKSEYLAIIADVNTGLEPERIDYTDPVALDSVVPVPMADAIPQGGVTYELERSPATMEQHQGSRRTTGWDDYIFTRAADNQTKIGGGADVTPANVEDRTVVFR